MKVCWVLSDAFSTSVEMTMWVFSSVQLMQYITLIFFFFFFPYIEPFLHSGNKSHLVLMYIIQYSAELCLPLFCWGFFFFISVQMSNWSVVFLSLSDFSIRELLPSQSELGSVPAYSVWKVWRIVFGRIHQWNHLTLAFSFLGMFFVIDSASYQLKVYSDFLFLFESHCIFLGICCFI